MQRIHIKEHIAQRIKPNQETSFYILKVLRLKANDQIKVFNENDGEHLAEVMCTKTCELKILTKLREHQQLSDLTLAVCIIKNKAFRRAIDAATQLGATAILPVRSERSQYQNFNSDKYLKCLIEAAEQSGRIDVPKLLPTTDLDQILNSQEYELIVHADEHKPKSRMTDLLPLPSKMAVMIGPEGGFTQLETEKIYSAPHTKSIKLTDCILRSEIAAAAALAQIQLLKQ